MIDPTSVEVQKIAWSSTRIAPRLDLTMYTTPNQWFRLKIEVMRTDTDDRDEKVSDVKINGRSIGACNPDGEANKCTFHDCSLNKNVLGDYLADTILRSNEEGRWKFELEYSHTVDAKPECNYNNQNRVQAAVGVSLDPIEGSLGTLHMNLILTFLIFGFNIHIKCFL